jgi:3,4-dihydroxy 2-butanone 4-phosphate synthase
LRLVLDSLREGKPILLHDFLNREDEVDVVIPSGAVSSEHIMRMRAEAGGLICFATTEEVLGELQIPPTRDLLARSGGILRVLAAKKMSYRDFPAFTIWLNHVRVRTGISDDDRALTIRELDKVVRLVWKNKVKEAREHLSQNFIAPGHVPILGGKSLSERQGHTELSLALCELAGIPPSIVLCEMLDANSSLPLDKARDFAKRHNIPLVSGREVLEAYREARNCPTG